jgi:vancomycin resistance protein YoaR
VFSFNETVGEISAITGYKQAFIIKEGQTILGDGGGVCQTSSTLFRAVLAAGLPILERTAHAYRVSYYEQNYPVGFDATIFQPAPDFKFKNDTPRYVLIQMEFDEKKKYLAFSIYGTSDGRRAETSKPRIWDVVPPPPDLYIDDPTLLVGQIKQTEHAAKGAKVAFDWKVTRGEEVLVERTFYSSYRPWQAVYLRGTKTN